VLFRSGHLVGDGFGAVVVRTSTAGKDEAYSNDDIFHGSLEENTNCATQLFFLSSTYSIQVL